MSRLIEVRRCYNVGMSVDECIDCLPYPVHLVQRQYDDLRRWRMPMEHYIERCWLCGMRLSSAFHYLFERFGFSEKRLLISLWRRLRSVQLVRHSPVVRKVVGLESFDYSDWQGRTGPGKVLLEILRS